MWPVVFSSLLSKERCRSLVQTRLLASEELLSVIMQSELLLYTRLTYRHPLKCKTSMTSSVVLFAKEQIFCLNELYRITNWKDLFISQFIWGCQGSAAGEHDSLFVPCEWVECVSECTHCIRVTSSVKVQILNEHTGALWIYGFAVNMCPEWSSVVNTEQWTVGLLEMSGTC